MMVKLPIDDGDLRPLAAQRLQRQRRDGDGRPGRRLLRHAGRGKDEVRLAYVLEAPKLERAARLLLAALDQYKHA